MRWEEISSAPKDGTKILVWLSSPWDRVEIVSWYEPYSAWVSGLNTEDIEYTESVIGSEVPTHWMNLPSKPLDLSLKPFHDNLVVDMGVKHIKYQLASRR